MSFSLVMWKSLCGIFLFVVGFLGVSRGVKYEGSALYDYIELQYSINKEKLPHQGLGLAELRQHVAPGSDARIFISDALVHIRMLQSRVAAPQGYSMLQQTAIQDIQELFHFQGRMGHPIMIIEFADFQCPYCQRQSKNKILDQVREAYPDDSRVAFAHFPLGGSYHALAEDAAIAAECVYDQVGSEGFYQFKNRSFAASLQPTLVRMKSYARGIAGVDESLFATCIADQETLSRVQQHKQRGIQLGVRGTPYTTVIDTRSGAFITLPGVQTLDRLRGQIDLFLAQE